MTLSFTDEEIEELFRRLDKTNDYLSYLIRKKRVKQLTKTKG